jgi:zinc protease
VAVLDVTVLPAALPSILPLLFSVAAEPSFPTDTLKTEYRHLKSEREALLDDPSSRAERRLLELLYRGHPYRLHASGPDGGFPLRRAQVLRFWRETWRPEGSTLLVCGRFSPTRVIALVQRASRGWSGQRARRSIPPPKEKPPLTSGIHMPGRAQADVCLGRLLPKREDAWYPALRILDNVLGHLALMGRLGTRLRTESGLAYYASSRMDACRLSTHWSLHVGVNPKQARRALRETREVLQKLRDRGVTHKELGLAKAGIIADLLTTAQTSSGLCNLLMPTVLSGLPLDYITIYADRIKNLNRKGVNEAAAAYCGPKSFSTVVASPDKTPIS